MFRQGKSSAAPSQRSRSVRAYSLALTVGLFFSGLALLLFAVIIRFFELPSGYGDVFAPLAFGVGCLAAGIFIGWAKRCNGLVNGAKSALIFMVPLVLLSMLTKGFRGDLLFERFITAVICGSVGGVIGVNKKKT